MVERSWEPCLFWLRRLREVQAGLGTGDESVVEQVGPGISQVPSLIPSTVG